jgi:uncharacterized protein
MSKRAFIIHGWDGSPQEGWFPWLKKELETLDFDVFVPAMPHPENPTIEDWVGLLESLVNGSDEDTNFIGHSVGCQTVLRYLEKLNGKHVGNVVLVAPWLTLTSAATPDAASEITAKPWVETPINLAKIRNVAKKYTAVFSSDDPLVPLKENMDLFKKQLGAETMLEENKGHFSGDDGVVELPHVLSAVLK